MIHLETHKMDCSCCSAPDLWCSIFHTIAQEEYSCARIVNELRKQSDADSRAWRLGRVHVDDAKEKKKRCVFDLTKPVAGIGSFECRLVFLAQRSWEKSSNKYGPGRSFCDRQEFGSIFVFFSNFSFRERADEESCLEDFQTPGTNGNKSSEVEHVTRF